MKDFIFILPELVLLLTFGLVLLGEITYHGERVRLISVTALLGLGSALIQTVIAFSYGPSEVFSRTLSVDGLSFFFRILFILLAALAVVMAGHSNEIKPAKRAEYISLILASIIGMSLAASSADLLLTFLALQFVNVSAFFLAGYSKRCEQSNEAAIKYMIFSAVAGALLVYGMAAIFGASKSLNIYEIHKTLSVTLLDGETAKVVFFLFLLALGFQIGAFPMHFWVPDVLQGAPTPVSAFLSVGSRVAGFAVAIRIFFTIFAKPLADSGNGWQALGPSNWPTIFAVFAGVTMLAGAFLALRQRSAKRMIACVLISQTGLMMLGLLVLDWVGVAALLYNLFVELFAVTGIFYVLSFLKNEVGSDRLDDLRGMLRWAPSECIYLILFTICLVGLPPMPGFIGKFALIGAAVGQHWSVLSVVAVFSLALSSLAMARLAFSLVGDFAAVSRAPVQQAAGRQAFLVTLAFPLLLVAVFAQQILGWMSKSITFILW